MKDLPIAFVDRRPRRPGEVQVARFNSLAWFVIWPPGARRLPEPVIPVTESAGSMDSRMLWTGGTESATLEGTVRLQLMGRTVWEGEVRDGWLRESQ